MPSDLQAVLKDVERAGTKFQQKYWVKVEEVKKSVKADGWSKALGKMGGNEEVAHSLYSHWTGDHDGKEAGTLKGAVIAALGKKLEDFSQGLGFAEGFNSIATVKTVVAMQAVTRAGLENKGYKPRTMYRAMGGDVRRRLVEAAKSQADAGVPYHEAAVSLSLNAVSSFSEDEEMAEQSFGSLVVALHDVPAHAYVGHYRVQGASSAQSGVNAARAKTGKVGTKEEKEGMLAFSEPTKIAVQDLRGKDAERIISYYKSKGLYDAEKVILRDTPPSTISQQRLSRDTSPRIADTEVLVALRPKKGSSDSDLERDIRSSGARVEFVRGAAKLVPVKSRQLDSFVNKFAKTDSFDADAHTPNSFREEIAKKMQADAEEENNVPDFGGVR